MCFIWILPTMLLFHIRLITEILEIACSNGKVYYDYSLKYITKKLLIIVWVKLMNTQWIPINNEINTLMPFIFRLPNNYCQSEWIIDQKIIKVCLVYFTRRHCRLYFRIQDRFKKYILFKMSMSELLLLFDEDFCIQFFCEAWFSVAFALLLIISLKVDVCG